MRSPDGVAVSTLDYHAEGWDIDYRWTHFLRIALESYFASKSVFFSKILLLELGLGQRWSLRESKLISKRKQPLLQQRLDVGNRAGAADTALMFHLFQAVAILPQVPK